MTQKSLFPNEKIEQFNLGGYGELQFFPEWIEERDADRYFSALLNEVNWSQPEIRVYGQMRRIPRLQAWYGDDGAKMSYSGILFEPEPWLPVLKQIKNAIELISGHSFNSVLVNRYRSGCDSVGWHADDEEELGDNPVIASVSLGAPRTFSLRPKSTTLGDAALKKRDLLLSHGDLMVMSGSTQKYWHHAVLKDKIAPGERINLTYRFICHRL